MMGVPHWSIDAESSARNTSRIPALKGRNVIAQGAALGIGAKSKPQALKGRNNASRRFSALSGLQSLPRSSTQGCALGYHVLAFQANCRTRRRPSAFTLFELILAIALSVALLALIGTAINLYLLQVDASRSHIEEAQLARSVLAMIADDLRATSVYKAQDTSGIASLVAASAKFDVDSVDNPSSGSDGGGGGGGESATSGNSSGGGSGTGSTGGGMSGGMSSMGGSSASGGASDANAENDLTLPLGINGTVEEMYVDVEHLPRLEELFLTNTGYTNTQPLATPVGTFGATPPRPNSVKTIRYFVRQGQPVAAGSAAVTSLAPDQQLEAGGLVRQEIARPARVWAEQLGDQTVLDSGQTLIAPEVAHIEFRYFDGTQVIDYWDMKEKGILPPSIEVRIWIWPANADATAANPGDLTSIMANCHEYRQIVFVPTSALSTSNAAAGMSGATSDMSSTSSSSSTSGSSSSGSGSSFEE